MLTSFQLFSATIDIEPVRACVIARHEVLTPQSRAQISACLLWVNDQSIPICQGGYSPIPVTTLAEVDGIQIKATHVSFYAHGRSQLSGHVEVRQNERIVNAETAYVYRDAQKNQVTKIELLGEVRYAEPDRLMYARKVTLNPLDKSGQIEDVLYRFNMNRRHLTLPVWGRASLIERFSNQDYRLNQVTYSTCPPQQESWHIEANEIKLDRANDTGTAKNAVLKVGSMPVFYSPYLTFPTSNKRKSGFLMPVSGYTNVGGFDAALPYYWNIAPNYDATLTPHIYTRRGLMLGGDFRYLTDNSSGILSGHFLPQDHAFGEFLDNNRQEFPQLKSVSSNRWSLLLNDSTMLVPNLMMNVNYQRVSDDYYFQDFSTNLAISSENQLLQEGGVTYTTNHWVLRGMLQSYQTLHPVNQVPVSDIYQRLPQLSAQGAYYELPMGVNLDVLGQFDYFRWPSNQAPFFQMTQPQGPRYHLNPILSRPYLRPWGYLTPSVELVENYYNVHYGKPMGFGVRSFDSMHDNNPLTEQSFNRTIPRFSLDSGLNFERLLGEYMQTFEPRLYYLNVPYENQTSVPVYDSANMIFTTDQLFRTNRFSGYDRIGDANQLAYAVTSRFISDSNGQEKASISVGQISYFQNRRVALCYQKNGRCMDSPLTLGYLSPTAKTSPIASHGTYRVNSVLSMVGDYVYDPHFRATNNGNLNVHYQPADNVLLTAGYSYLVNGNLLPTAFGGIQNSALHQATVAYAAPLTDRWSTLGAYSYNISKGYTMLGLLGIQYENCCWAARLLGGSTFKSLSEDSLKPQYNNNVYFQVLLKGLGTVSSSDPSSIINTYLPGLRSLF